MASLIEGAPDRGPQLDEVVVRSRRTAHPVLMFLARRIAAGILTLLVVSVLIFLATNALPGNVAQVVLGRNGTPQLVHLLDQRLGLDRSLVSRYGSWLSGIFQGNLGDSAVEVAQSAPNPGVAGPIFTALANSLVLAIATTILLVPLSLLLGTWAAVRAGRASDYATSYASLVLGALPEFVLGTFLIVIFFTQLNLLPAVSLVPPGTSPLANVNALILPIVTLLGVSLSFCVRQVRAGVIQALRQDYVSMARLSGLPETKVLRRYALRNALAPSIQTFAQSIQYLFGGIVVVESLYAYPGIGSMLVRAVSARDVTEVQAITLVLAAAFIFINIFADLIVVLIVPKLRTSLA
jgi:peptide/nickel transport system permease protein